MFMDWKSVVFYLLLILFGWFLASITAIGKETISRVIKMGISYIYRFFIKKGWAMGDFPIDIAKFREATKEPVDSEWSIRIESRYDKPIEKCKVLLGKEELRWANNKERKEIIIRARGSESVRIPREMSFAKDTRVQVWDGKNILRNRLFNDLPII